MTMLGRTNDFLVKNLNLDWVLVFNTVSHFLLAALIFFVLLLVVLIAVGGYKLGVVVRNYMVKFPDPTEFVRAIPTPIINISADGTRIF